MVLSFFLTICTLFGIYNLFNHTPYLKSKLYWSIGESELSTNQAQAKIYYNKALQINPKSIDKLEKAATFNKLKLYIEAKNELTEILQLDSQNLAALLQRAIASIELKDYRDALIDIDSAFSLLNNVFLSKKNIKIRPSLHFFRSRILVELGEYDDALNEIELTLNEPPQCKERFFRRVSCLSTVNAEAYYQKSIILSRLGMHLEADLVLSLAKEQEALGINERYVLKY